MTEMRNHNEEKAIGEGVGFERIRRITGYLVGTTDRWNNAKRAEEHRQPWPEPCKVPVPVQVTSSF